MMITTSDDHVCIFFFVVVVVGVCACVRVSVCVHVRFRVWFVSVSVPVPGAFRKALPASARPSAPETYPRASISSTQPDLYALSLLPQCWSWQRSQRCCCCSTAAIYVSTASLNGTATSVNSGRPASFVALGL
eukprot:3937329-Rhodomonas_salina.3